MCKAFKVFKVFKVENMTYEIEGARESRNDKKTRKNLLKNISFELAAGEFLAILGPNGSGKSTLLRALGGVLPDQPLGLDGKVSLNHRDQGEIFKKSEARRQWAKQCGLLPDSVTPWVNMSVQEYVELGRYPYGECGESGEGETATETKRYSDAALDFVSAGNLKLQGVHSLSSGEFQRVALARVLAQLGLPNLLPEASESCLKILLLDEPLAHLDLYYQYYFLKLLENLGKHVSVICVMHEINLAAKYADKFLLIKDGEILDFGDKAILTAQNLTTLFGIELTEWAMPP